MFETTLTARQKAVIDVFVENPVQIGYWVGFDLLQDIHNDWLKTFLFSKEDVTLLGHRGSYKTTVLSLFLAIHAVIAPTETVIFFRKTDTDTAEVLKQTKNVLRSEAMAALVMELYGVHLELTVDNASEISTNLSVGVKGSSQIIGLGIGTSITGKHADVVITDDIVNLKDRISRAEREKTKLSYMELENVKNRGGRFINTGTPWHKDDAIQLMPNQQRYDCYSTGLISKEDLQELRQKMTDSLFAANYELKHIADEDALFKDPQYTDDVEMIYGGMSHVDAAYGGADGTAYTVFREVGDTIYGYGRLWQEHIDDCKDKIRTLQKVLRAGSIACEKNADKGYLARELESMGMFPNLYSENMNKYVKISTYLRKNWHRIKWLSDTDPEYINQILDYTEHAEHDDAPDSAASLLRRMEDTITYNYVSGGI